VYSRGPTVGVSGLLWSSLASGRGSRTQFSRAPIAELGCGGRLPRLDGVTVQASEAVLSLVRKLWTLGALVIACAFGWRQGAATQAIELRAADGPFAGIVPEPGPSGAAARAVRRVVLRQALREIISPSVEWSEVPFLPSMLEALLSQRPPAEPARFGAEPRSPGDEAARGVAAQWLAAPPGAKAFGEQAPPDALATLSELLDPGPVLH
jgi:hypothetical protein